MSDSIQASSPSVQIASSSPSPPPESPPPAPSPTGKDGGGKPGEIQLKVLEGYTRDVGRGVARIDYDAMDAVDASTGDVIEVKGGKRRTVAKCLPLYPSDEGRGIVRIDGLIRNNAGVAIGDMVVVRKVKAPPAETVTVVPLDKIPPIDGRYLADGLESVPVTKGDNVIILYFGGKLEFQVVEVTPIAEAVLITQRTVFIIKGDDKQEQPLSQSEVTGELKLKVPPDVSAALGLKSGDVIEWNVARLLHGRPIALLRKVLPKETRNTPEPSS